MDENTTDLSCNEILEEAQAFDDYDGSQDKEMYFASRPNLSLLSDFDYGVFDLVPFKNQADAMLPEDLECVVALASTPAAPNLLGDLIDFQFDVATCGIDNSCLNSSVAGSMEALLHALSTMSAWNRPRVEEIVWYILAVICSRSTPEALELVLSSVSTSMWGRLLFNIACMEPHLEACCGHVCDGCPYPLCLSSLTLLGVLFSRRQEKEKSPLTRTFVRSVVEYANHGQPCLSKASMMLLHNVNKEAVLLAVEEGYFNTCISCILDADAVTDMALLGSVGLFRVHKLMSLFSDDLRAVIQFRIAETEVFDHLVIMFELVMAQPMPEEDSEVWAPALRGLQYQKLALLIPTIVQLSHSQASQHNILIDSGVLDAIEEILQSRLIPNMVPLVRALFQLYRQSRATMINMLSCHDFLAVLLHLFFAFPANYALLEYVLALLSVLASASKDVRSFMAFYPGLVIMMLDCIQKNVAVLQCLCILSALIQENHEFCILANQNNAADIIRHCLATRTDDEAHHGNVVLKKLSENPSYDRRVGRFIKEIVERSQIDL